MKNPRKKIKELERKLKVANERADFLHSECLRLDPMFTMRLMLEHSLNLPPTSNCIITNLTAGWN